MGEKPGFFLNGRLLSWQKKSRVSLFAHFFVLYKERVVMNHLGTSIPTNIIIRTIMELEPLFMSVTCLT